ncbi:MAG: symmetrical bis(5'-nucleosyl)-tetraphosphatase [Gammaproteobacteria bacterium]|nr:symmetrical bis(5'-nucleosyl)-tetraphosphatase [Gammaproteobacteria bacterium]
MSTYAIGDIQGCYDELQQLLQQLHFDPARDTLWFTGDLVNRGPKSLETLRFVKGLGERAITVLGNHDLHLLAVWQHQQKHIKADDTLAAIFAAADGEELLQWLRQRPLMHYDAALDYAMLHAGLPPQWSRDEALARAAEVEAVLRGERFHEFLGHMYGNKPARWSDRLTGWDRLRFIVNCFTRLRLCSEDGQLEFKYKGELDNAPAGYRPWFELAQRQSRQQRLVVGHWSALGLYRQHNVNAIDTGCLWGGTLTALQLESGEVTALDCQGVLRP